MRTPAAVNITERVTWNLTEMNTMLYSVWHVNGTKIVCQIKTYAHALNTIVFHINSL